MLWSSFDETNAHSFALSLLSLSFSPSFASPILPSSRARTHTKKKSARNFTCSELCTTPEITRCSRPAVTALIRIWCGERTKKSNERERLTFEESRAKRRIAGLCQSRPTKTARKRSGFLPTCHFAMTFSRNVRFRPKWKQESPPPWDTTNCELRGAMSAQTFGVPQGEDLAKSASILWHKLRTAVRVTAYPARKIHDRDPGTRWRKTRNYVTAPEITGINAGEARRLFLSTSFPDSRRRNLILEWRTVGSQYY